MTTYTEQELELALSKAKISMMTNRSTTFLSTVCCGLDTVFDDSVPTAATDGISILINTNFFMALPIGQRVFLLAHETLHVVYEHMLRRGERNPRKWNVAADYLINAELIEQGFEFIPIGLYDPKYIGMSTDEIYQLLDKDVDNIMLGDLTEPEYSDEVGTSNATAVADRIRDIVVRAVQVADLQNASASVPGTVRRRLAYMAKPKVSWRVELKRFAQLLAKNKYSYSRPNRRYEKVYMPSKKGVQLGKISFAIDTSGSISIKQFNQFVSEVFHVIKTIKPKELELMQFDHALQSVDSIKSIKDLLSVEFKGNGGTNPSVALNHFIDSDSKGLIIITDGYFMTLDLPAPAHPVIWIVFNNKSFTAPFGKVTHITL